jgi:four helix bundle protein
MKCETLDVWKMSARLSAEVYKAMAALKDFGFKDQITRSGLSIPSNIAEGMEKESGKDKARFLNIAEGSISELITQIYIGMEIEYIPSDIGKKWKNELEQISKMIKKLKKSILSKEENR